jgi:hypothetical protein
MSEEHKRALSQSQAEPAQLTQVYANSVNFTLGAFDAFLDFALRTPEEQNPKPLVRVHMSIQHAWVMAKIIDRLFAAFRQQGGKFTIPEQVLNELGLLEEYREDMGG